MRCILLLLTVIAACACDGVNEISYIIPGYLSGNDGQGYEVSGNQYGGEFSRKGAQWNGQYDRDGRHNEVRDKDHDEIDVGLKEEFGRRDEIPLKGVVLLEYDDKNNNKGEIRGFNRGDNRYSNKGDFRGNNKDDSVVDNKGNNNGNLANRGDLNGNNKNNSSGNNNDNSNGNNGGNFNNRGNINGNNRGNLNGNNFNGNNGVDFSSNNRGYFQNGNIRGDGKNDGNKRLEPRYLIKGLTGRFGLGFQKRNFFAQGMQFPITPEILQPIGYRKLIKDRYYEPLPRVFSVPSSTGLS